MFIEKAYWGTVSQKNVKGSESGKKMETTNWNGSRILPEGKKDPKALCHA